MLIIKKGKIGVGRVNFKVKKMQWKTADFAPLLSPDELDVTFALSLILAHSLHYVKNMMSSTKPELYNILHCRQRMTQPRPQATCTENLVQFGHVVLRYASWQTNRQTNIHTNMLITIPRPPAGGEINLTLATSVYFNQVGTKDCRI